jgi:hypothetical protein
VHESPHVPDGDAEALCDRSDVHEVPRSHVHLKRAGGTAFDMAVDKVSNGDYALRPHHGAAEPSVETEPGERG